MIKGVPVTQESERRVSLCDLCSLSSSEAFEKGVNASQYSPLYLVDRMLDSEMLTRADYFKVEKSVQQELP